MQHVTRYVVRGDTAYAGHGDYADYYYRKLE
jgi:hypothetical protein